MKPPTRPEDRTGRWLVLQRHDHKDGGYFWSVRGWYDGMNDKAPSALLESLEDPSWPSRKYAVLDWRAARYFRLDSRVVELE